MRINCDIGERGADHPVDRQLMKTVDIANIACGGHAGDQETVEAFRRIAADEGVTVTAHLSYPDRENFGRATMPISLGELMHQLQVQRELMKDITAVKFHGALYNDTCVDEELAQVLGNWLGESGFTHVLTMPNSALARVCQRLDLTVIAEAFAERRYQFDEPAQTLVLRPRRHSDATIHDVAAAMDQVRDLITRHSVTAVDGRTYQLNCDTVCIHSDSPIALELAQRIRREFG